MKPITALVAGAGLAAMLAAPAVAQQPVPDGWQSDAVVEGAEFHEIPDAPVGAAVTMEQRLTNLLNFIGGRADFAEFGPVWREGDRYLVYTVTADGNDQYWVLDGSAYAIALIE
jgi:hypothetical protein